MYYVCHTWLQTGWCHSKQQQCNQPSTHLFTKLSPLLQVHTHQDQNIQYAQCVRAQEARPHHTANVIIIIELKQWRQQLKKSSIFKVKKCGGPTKTVHTLPRYRRLIQRDTHNSSNDSTIPTSQRSRCYAYMSLFSVHFILSYDLQQLIKHKNTT